MRRRIVIAVAALVASAGLALTFASAQDKKPAEPSAKGAKAEDPAAKRADIERRLFVMDHVQRSKAAWEAIKLGADFPEEQWFKLLEMRFPTVVEEEMAMYHAAYALSRSGSPRAIPWLKKILARAPTEFCADQPARPKFLYQAEASYGLWRLAADATFSAVDARLKHLDAGSRAEALARLWVEGDRSYQAHRPADTPDAMPTFWRMGLEEKLGELGGVGVRAMAHAVESLADAELRGQMLLVMSARFVQKGAAGDEDAKNRWRKDPGVRASVAAAARATMRGNPTRSLERYAFSMVSKLDLKEVEDDLMTFIEHGREDSDLPELQSFKQLAVNTLAHMGSDAALDFIVRRGRPLPTGLVRPDAFVPRYVAAAAREDPCSAQLGTLLGCAYAGLRHVEVAQVERILARLASTEPANALDRSVLERNANKARRLLTDARAAQVPAGRGP